MQTIPSITQDFVLQPEHTSEQQSKCPRELENKLITPPSKIPNTKGQKTSEMNCTPGEKTSGHRHACTNRKKLTDEVLDGFH